MSPLLGRRGCIGEADTGVVYRSIFKKEEKNGFAVQILICKSVIHPFTNSLVYR